MGIVNCAHIPVVTPEQNRAKRSALSSKSGVNANLSLALRPVHGRTESRKVSTSACTTATILYLRGGERLLLLGATMRAGLVGNGNILKVGADQIQERLRNTIERRVLVASRNSCNQTQILAVT